MSFANRQKHDSPVRDTKGIVDHRFKPVDNIDSTQMYNNRLISPPQTDNSIQAVQRPIRSKVAFDFSDIRISNIQAKLRISQPDDIYEQEADRVAEQVVDGPPSSDSSLQETGCVAGNGRALEDNPCIESTVNEKEKMMDIGRKTTLSNRNRIL